MEMGRVTVSKFSYFTLRVMADPANWREFIL